MAEGVRTVKPTSEQQEILDAVASGYNVSIMAGAGTGKTTTLNMIANSTPLLGGYSAFNRAIVDEAKRSFPRHVTARTMHSLAWGDMHRRKHHSCSRIGKYEEKPWATARRLKEIGVTIPSVDVVMKRSGRARTLSDSTVLSLCNTAVNNFCQSMEKDVEPFHFSFQNRDYDSSCYPEIRRTLLPFARGMWRDIKLKNGKLYPTTLTHMTRMWADLNPTIFPNASYILFDEAQDADPLMARVIARQDHLQKILVGDKYQNLYDWRGTINLMGHSPWETVEKRLLKSWRFGRGVANYANKILTSPSLSSEWKLAPNTDIKSIVDIVPDDMLWTVEYFKTLFGNSNGLICQRTNAGGLEMAFLCQEAGLSYDCQLSLTGMKNLVEDLEKLQEGKRVTSGILNELSSIQELYTSAADTRDIELKHIVQLYDNSDKDLGKVAQALAAADRHDSNPQVIISTAHRLKGLEADTVLVGRDFSDPVGYSVAASMQHYVVTTRARRKLVISEFTDEVWDNLHSEDLTDERVNLALQQKLKCEKIADLV